MTKLTWDNVGNRVYETGLDQGVLYLPDGSGVPWNGLTSIIEQFNSETTPVYYDGKKINDLVVLGDFVATMRAITYPDEFVGLEGLGRVTDGLYLSDQPPQTFGLCYRTHIGNDVNGLEFYKIHIIYNVTAIPSEKAHSTLSDQITLTEFAWTITAVPEEAQGFRPSAHAIIDTRHIDPFLLELLESMLYGDSNANAALIPMTTLMSYLTEWYRVKITDNGDGTWTAHSIHDSFIQLDEVTQTFTIFDANVVYLLDDMYQISDTYGSPPS